MTNISAKELKKKLDSKKKPYLVDVLSENSFKLRHIPGAKNVPFGEDFIKNFKKKIKASKKDEVIVYCSSKTCQASVNAAEALEEERYKNVVHFAGGLAGWQDAGYEFDGEESE